MNPDDGIVRRVRVAAYAWIEDAGQVLLVRVAADTPGAGRWTVPGGGLAFGEDPPAGLAREIAEETGLTAVAGELVGIRSAILDPAETPSGHLIHAVGILYRAAVTGGELRFEADGSTDRAEWVRVEELDRRPAVGLLGWARRAVGR